MQRPGFILYNGIFVTSDKISMIEGKSEVITVYKRDIRHISLKDGYQSERPVVQIIFGVAVLLISVYPILKLMIALISDIKVGVSEFLMLAMLPIGVWAIRSAMKRGYYLDVELEDDHRKLGFQLGRERTGMKEFIKQAATLGYVIEAATFQDELRPQ